MEGRKIQAAFHHLLHFRAHPDGQIEGESISVIHVRKHGKRHLRLRFELGNEFLPVGHDGDDLASAGRQFPVRLHQRADVDAAIGTPMPAMEGDGNRSAVQKLIEADQLRGLVGEDEWGHRFADLRCRLAGTILTKPIYKPVHCGGKIRPFAAADVTTANVGKNSAENVSCNSTMSAKNITVGKWQSSIFNGTPKKQTMANVLQVLVRSAHGRLRGLPFGTAGDNALDESQGKMLLLLVK